MNIEYRLAKVIPVQIYYDVHMPDFSVGDYTSQVEVLSVEYNGKAFEPEDVGLSYEYLADWVAEQLADSGE